MKLLVKCLKDNMNKCLKDNKNSIENDVGCQVRLISVSWKEGFLEDAVSTLGLAG